MVFDILPLILLKQLSGVFDDEEGPA